MFLVTGSSNERFTGSYRRELTAKDAKETTIEESWVLIENCVLGSVIFCIRIQVFYFATLASFKGNCEAREGALGRAVRLYKAQMTLLIGARLLTSLYGAEGRRTRAFHPSRE